MGLRWLLCQIHGCACGYVIRKFAQLWLGLLRADDGTPSGTIASHSSISHEVKSFQHPRGIGWATYGCFNLRYLRCLQGGLSPPSPLGTSLLLPRPWAALLRLLLQQKVPAQTLKKLAGPVILGEEEALEEVIWACLPKITRDIWQQTPHRMYSAEAEVPTCPPRPYCSDIAKCFPDKRSWCPCLEERQVLLFTGKKYHA